LPQQLLDSHSQVEHIEDLKSNFEEKHFLEKQ